MKATPLNWLALALLTISLPSQIGVEKTSGIQVPNSKSPQEKPPEKKKEGKARDAKIAPAPTPKEALDLIQKVKKEKLEDLQVELLEKAGRCDDAQVATKIAPFLKDKRDDLRIAAIRSLRFMRNKKALPALLSAASQFEKDKVAGPEYFLALGQHGNPKSISKIIHRAWEPLSKEIFKAKIQALAHIRSSKTVSELEKLNRKFKAGRHGINRREVLKAIELLIDEKMPKSDRSKRMEWVREASKKPVPLEPKNLPKNYISAYKKLWKRPDEKIPHPKKKKKRKKK
jgi:hypothetical protein